MKAVVAAFNQEKALVGALSVITNLLMDIFEAQVIMQSENKYYRPIIGIFHPSQAWRADIKHSEDICNKCQDLKRFSEVEI